MSVIGDFLIKGHALGLLLIRSFNIMRMSFITYFDSGNLNCLIIVEYA